MLLACIFLRALRSTFGLPAACFACMMAATFSLSAACWEPDMVVLFFYWGVRRCVTWRERDKISRYAPHRQPSSEQPRGPSHAGCHGPSWLEGSQGVILLTDCRNGREKSHEAARVQLLKSVERGCDGLSEREKGQSSTARYFYQRDRRKLRSRLLGWPVRASFSLCLHVLRAFHSLPSILPVTV